MLMIDHLAYQNRWRNINPLTKFFSYLAVLISVFWLPPIVQIVLAFGLILLTIYVAKISLRRYLLWLLLPSSFLLLSLIGILLSFSRNAENMLFSISFGSFYFGVYERSIFIAMTVVCRSFAALIVTGLFVMSTPFNQLITIGKRCKVPLLLLEITLLTYRFIFIFLEEMVMIYRIQTLRFGYRTLKTGYHSLAILVVMLFERVFIRYRQMAIALEMKLYQGQFHV